MRQATSLQDRLNQINASNANNVGLSSLQVVKANTAVDTYAAKRNADILEALRYQGFDNLMQPNETELTYINSVFNNKGFNDISKVTFSVVNDIGKAECQELNERLKKFTGAMKAVDTTGVLGLMDDLSKDVASVDLEGIWKKAVDARVPFWVSFLNFFRPSYARKFTSEKLSDLQAILSGRSGQLELKLVSLERSLRDQKEAQTKNILMLEETFKVYYEAFMQLRQQFALIVYLEWSYKSQLETYKLQNAARATDLTVDKTLQDYEEIYSDIQNKRLILHKMLLQLPITVQQNNNLVKVCKSLMKETDNTLVSSFPMIRSNMIQICIALQAQRSFLSNEAAQKLEANSAAMATKATNDLTVKATLLASEARKREAQTTAKMVEDVLQFQETLKTVKAEATKNFEEASSILAQASEDVKKLIETN